jgi:hypothetical protein
MVTAELVLDDKTISVPRIDLLLKCRRFLEDSALAKAPYWVNSSVALSP